MSSSLLSPDSFEGSRPVRYFWIRDGQPCREGTAHYHAQTPISEVQNQLIQANQSEWGSCWLTLDFCLLEPEGIDCSLPLESQPDLTFLFYLSGLTPHSGAASLGDLRIPYQISSEVGPVVEAERFFPKEVGILDVRRAMEHYLGQLAIEMNLEIQTLNFSSEAWLQLRSTGHCIQPIFQLFGTEKPGIPGHPPLATAPPELSAGGPGASRVELEAQYQEARRQLQMTMEHRESELLAWYLGELEKLEAYSSPA